MDLKERFLKTYGLADITEKQFIKLILIVNKIVTIPPETDTIKALENFVYQVLIVYQTNSLTETVQRI